MHRIFRIFRKFRGGFYSVFDGGGCRCVRPKLQDRGGRGLRRHRPEGQWERGIGRFAGLRCGHLIPFRRGGRIRGSGHVRRVIGTSFRGWLGRGGGQGLRKNRKKIGRNAPVHGKSGQGIGGAAAADGDGQRRIKNWGQWDGDGGRGHATAFLGSVPQHRRNRLPILYPKAGNWPPHPIGWSVAR